MTMNAKRIARRATALLIAVTLALPVTALAGNSVQSKKAGDTDGPATTATQNGPQETSDDCDPTVERAMALKQAQGTEGAGGSEGAPGSGESAQNRTGLSEERRQQVKSRVRERVRTHANRFEMAGDVFTDKIDRLEEIAALVEGSGGDASEVYALLDEARALLAQADALEAEAIALFEAIADADDPRAAFQAARDKAREAVQTLRDARAKIRDAVALLAGMVGELEASG